MARRYIPIEDLTSEGLREDVASTKKLWKTLENVRRGTGGWQKRPGINRIDTGTLPAVSIGNPKQIITFKHPASSSQSEVIRPTNQGNYHQWTNSPNSSNWQNVNEVTADDVVFSYLRQQQSDSPNAALLLVLDDVESLDTSKAVA